MATITPLMKQFQEMKRRHPDAILLFRVGDFYETFGEDAEIASEVLGITLTRRANGAKEYINLAGFPHHALETYLPKLVRAGKRVAICEQLEKPQPTEVVTPAPSLCKAIEETKRAAASVAQAAPKAAQLQLTFDF